MSSTYGTWSITVDFECVRAEKKITRTGVYTINLEGQLTDTTGDLNLYKLSSNYLDDVPMHNGEVGHTGDMDRAEVEGGVEGDGDHFSFTWIPPDQPAHFPIEENSRLSTHVIGKCNNVDTLKQGHPFQINPAYKPSIKVVLNSRQDNAKMSFGGIYDLDTSQDFASDNVAITPLVKIGTTETEFLFDLEFESTALPGDGEPNCPEDYDALGNAGKGHQAGWHRSGRTEIAPEGWGRRLTGIQMREHPVLVRLDWAGINQNGKAHLTQDGTCNREEPAFSFQSHWRTLRVEPDPVAVRHNLASYRFLGGLLGGESTRHSRSTK